MAKPIRLYSMKAVADLIENIDPRKVLAEAYRLKIRVMDTGRVRVVDEISKDRLVKHFADTAQLANAS